MIEFGSDFHLINDYFLNRATINNIYKNALYFACGRQSLISIIQQEKWKRIWMPEYFCYEIIKSLEKTGIDIQFYMDYPGCNDNSIISKINFKNGDVLFRINYFGLRDFRTNKHIPVPVIEDHSHDLLGHWALFSDADWCIASLRKSFPIAEGGILWSPRDKILTQPPKVSKENEILATKRWNAMTEKKDFLCGKNIEKENFRNKYIETENNLENLPISSIDKTSMDYICKFDINAWYNQKKANLKILAELKSSIYSILSPEDSSCNTFSYIILTNSPTEREFIKEQLVKKNIYPAVLWNIPDYQSKKVKDIGNKIISIHCDGRYSESDTIEMAQRIKQIINNDKNH